MRAIITITAALSVNFFALNLMANVVGSDIQNFNPTTNGLDFVTVQSPQTLAPGVFNFGYFINYAVNTLPNYTNVQTQSRTDFQDALLGADINFGLGLKSNWDIGMSFPQIYAQDTSGDADVFRGQVARAGLTEYRLNTKYRFSTKDNYGLATVLSLNVNRTENNPFTGTDSGPTYNAELVYGSKWQDYYYAFNLGYRFRNPGRQLPNIPVVPYDDQWIWSAAISRYFEKMDIKLIGEIFGSLPAKDEKLATDRDITTAELLLGVKKDFKNNIAAHLGGGTEIYHGSGTADWRIYTGLNWNYGPVWKGRDSNSNARELHPEATYFGTKPDAKSETFVSGGVLFATNSDTVTPEFEKVLLDFAKYLNTPPGFKKLRIEGHTDSVGPDDYNLNLSIRRAQAVMQVLIEKGGIPKDKVSAAGFGESKPIDDNANFQGRAKNRRVEFIVTR
jgi:outer membrane protein OmpA-like peptidoglycan-associated protein